MTLQFRPATRDDLGAIAAIQAASPEAAAWEPPLYLDYDCTVAVSNGTLAGFLVSRRIVEGEWELLNIAVDPASRRQGLGEQLLRHALRASPGQWFLEVRESNSAAIHLYKKLGFSPAGRRKDYYRNPPEAAIVMRILS